MQLSAFPLVFGGRSIYGSLAGTAIDTEDALAFSVLENIRPMIETVPLEEAADGYARMMQGKARFRMVLVTKDGVTREASTNDKRLCAQSLKAFKVPKRLTSGRDANLAITVLDRLAPFNACSTRSSFRVQRPLEQDKLRQP